MTRPRRAIEKPEDDELAAGHAPRRSSGFVPADDRDGPSPPEPPLARVEPEDDETPPHRGRRALPPLPDPEEAAEPTQVPVAPSVAPRRTWSAPEPVVPPASSPSPDEPEEPRPARARIDAGGEVDVFVEEPATVPVTRRPARALIDPEPAPTVRPSSPATPPRRSVPEPPAATPPAAVSPPPTPSKPPAPPPPKAVPKPTPAPPPVVQQSTAATPPVVQQPTAAPPPPVNPASAYRPIASAPVAAEPRPGPAPATHPAPVARPAEAAPPPTAVQPDPVPPATPSPTDETSPANPVPRPASMSRTGRRPSPAAPDRRPVSKRRGNREVPPIVIDRLVKAYNGVLAVRNLSFEVEPGRITGFLGPNGAGKTTTLRVLVGLAAPTTGTATFGGTAYADLPRPQETVGAVLDAKFHPGRTGRNHLRVLAATAGVSDRRVDHLLERVGLSEHARRPAGQYSLGMRQRLALAAALIGNPDYLILDEPANGLDPEGIRWLRTFLREFAATGRAVLVSSHLLNEVQATVDEIVVIHKGRLLTQMPMSELQLGEGTTRARVSDPDHAAQVLEPLGVRVEWAADERGPYLRVHSQEVAAVGAALFNAGIVVHELVTERRDLEQEFFSMLEASR